MITLRRAFVCTGMLLMIGILLVACGQAAGTGTGNNNNMNNNNNMTNYPTATATSANQMMTPTAQATMGMQPTPTSGMSGDNGNMNAFVHTAFVMLNGKKVHVLTTNKGFVLYYYAKDTMNTAKCTGGCAQSWPPLLQPKGMMTITSSIMLPHKLTIHMTANGNQIFYDGHALYTYTGDMQAGQFSGRGMDSAWYLVGVNL